MNWKVFFKNLKKSPEEKELDAKKLRNKESIHLQVENLMTICKNLILKAETSGISGDNKITNASFSKVKGGLGNTLEILADAHKSIEDINSSNIDYIVEKLNEAFSAISSLDGNVINHVFISKTDKTNINTIRSTLEYLIKNLPKMKNEI